MEWHPLFSDETTCPLRWVTWLLWLITVFFGGFAQFVYFFQQFPLNKAPFLVFSNTQNFGLLQSPIWLSGHRPLGQNLMVLMVYVSWSSCSHHLSSWSFKCSFWFHRHCTPRWKTEKETWVFSPCSVAHQMKNFPVFDRKSPIGHHSWCCNPLIFIIFNPQKSPFLQEVWWNHPVSPAFFSWFFSWWSPPHVSGFTMSSAFVRRSPQAPAKLLPQVVQRLADADVSIRGLAAGKHMETSSDDIN